VGVSRLFQKNISPLNQTTNLILVAKRKSSKTPLKTLMNFKEKPKLLYSATICTVKGKDNDEEWS
jgi:hypothetical protein